MEEELKKLEEMLFSEKEFTAANGQTLTWREYLDQFIKAFEMKPFDYYSAHYALTKMNEEKNHDKIIEKLGVTWAELELQFGFLSPPE